MYVNLNLPFIKSSIKLQHLVSPAIDLNMENENEMRNRFAKPSMIISFFHAQTIVVVYFKNI